ncbi:VOC family protein [Thermaerobacillus caldiproteolyticus]|uniref:Putative enzyme related to lactoylglutathione lyase n=1 Tax=Thermaerobacillus caldiproteolyticus TaxID=247480 RepID=A0A7V9Z628_9BACL|nr:VOC family protein [Anoxybacillus caldiproteolyticus]MBA2874732.1 putative enzyme related to lactoylglutathione lyase [Anoxybacillus caldiproteolyticus]QPA31500.1 VOC family protein [Anoxybacillus caldiproteolyticus]
MIKRIATVAIYVEDQQKAKEFWTEKAGFEVVAEHPMGPNAFWLEVAPKGAQTALVIYPKTMMKDWNERKPSIVFECDDVLGTYETMKARGVEFLGEPQKMQWGTFVQFKDIDGNEFVLKG